MAKAQNTDMAFDLGSCALISHLPFLGLPKKYEGKVEMQDRQVRRGSGRRTRRNIIFGPARMGTTED
jgi:hypothetical protein